MLVMFSMMKDASPVDLKYILTITLDYIQSVAMHGIMRQLTWTQGLEVILNTSFEAEP